MVGFAFYTQWFRVWKASLFPRLRQVSRSVFFLAGKSWTLVSAIWQNHFLFKEIG